MTMWKHYEFSSCEKFSARTEYQYRYVCRHRVHNSARTLCSWEVVFRAYREVYMIHEECRSLKKKKNYFIQRILANATSMIMRSERNPSKTSTVGVSKKKNDNVTMIRSLSFYSQLVIVNGNVTAANADLPNGTRKFFGRVFFCLFCYSDVLLHANCRGKVK